MDSFDREEKERKKLEKRIDKFRGEDGQPEGPSPWQGLYLLGSLGFVVAGSILLGLAVGVYLDRRWHTEPKMTLVGLVVGLLSAGMGAYQLVKGALKQDK